MLLSKSYNNSAGSLFSNSVNNLDLTQTNIEAEMVRLKEEEKLLQTVLEIKIRNELINHLERDNEIENLKNTSINLNNSYSQIEIDANSTDELNERNMTTTHSLMHRIAHDCPICEKNNISSLIISSGNERTLQKSNSTLKFQNKPEPIKTNPNVIFSRAYKTERPHYVKNLKSLIQTPVIKDFDSSLRLTYSDTSKSPKSATRAKSTSDLMNRSVQFEKNNTTLDGIPRNLTAKSTNERDFANAIRDRHFYGNDMPRHTSASLNDKQQESKFIKLPISKTLVHDRAWGYGKNTKFDYTTYYPFRDSQINKLKK